MKPHEILKSFNGSQTGNDFNKFEAGTIANLSKDLAAIAVKEGWATPVKTISEPKPELIPDAPNFLVEAKVTGPEETKVVEPEETKKKKGKK